MSPSVSLAAPHERLAALRLLFPDVVESPRDGIEAAALFVARGPDCQVRAAALAQALPGALGLVQQAGAELSEEVDALARAACDWLRSRGVKVCQAFATSDEAARMVALERYGFQRITQLVALRLAVGAGGSPSALTYTFEEPPFSAAFQTALLATDADTLDCPELTGARTRDELLASFTTAAPGTQWRLAWHAGEPVGVVMLGPRVAEGELELAYLGVTPPARRRGFGRELVAWARAEASARGASSLTVSVDSRNNPALQLYCGAGFVETARRLVWLAHFSGDTALPAHGSFAERI